MKRRAFLTALCAAATLPFPVRAQRVPQIGVLDAGSPELHKPGDAALEAGLKQLGYTPGNSVALVYSYAGSEIERLPELARRLVARGVDVIVSGGVALPAAHDATKAIPIVVVQSTDLVAMGLAESLGHPGANVTGQSIFVLELLVKRAELLKQIKPTMDNVGLLFPNYHPSMQSLLDSFEGAVKALGLTPKRIEVADPGEIDRVLPSGPNASVDGLVVLDHPMFLTPHGAAAVADAAMRRGLPTAADVFAARAGPYLLGFGVDYLPLWRGAAVFVDKILKGNKPGDIPIQRATKFLTTVNLNTAKALGLAIPPTLLAAADEVIE